MTDPLYGHSRHIYVAETDTEAHTEAMAALARWFESFNYLWMRDRGEEYWPSDLEAFAEEGYLVAGSPDTVRRRLREYLPVWGGNYFLGAFAFGGLTRDQTLRSLDLFMRHVIPGLQ